MAFLSNHALRAIEDASDAKLIGDVQKDGFHIVGISEDGDLEKVEYGFTVGCYYSFGIPEAVLYGMRFGMMKSMFWNYVDWAKRNPSMCSGIRTDELANLPMMLRTVDVSWYAPLLGYANWFYHKLPAPYPCVQLTWPDRAGRFDTEAGFDEAFRSIQPDLSVPFRG